MLKYLILLGTLLVLGCGGDPVAPPIDAPPVVSGTFHLTEFRLLDLMVGDSAIFPLHTTEESFLELTFSNYNGPYVEGKGLLIFDHWLNESDVPFCLLGSFSDATLGLEECIEPLDFNGTYSLDFGVVTLFLNDFGSYIWLDYRTMGISYGLQGNQLVFDRVDANGTRLIIKFTRF
jgi:hypothetical protein